MKHYFIPVRLVLSMKKAGISLSKAHEMLEHSARITHTDGNRRYQQYLFMLEGDKLLSFKVMTPEEVQAEDERIRTYVKAPRSERTTDVFYRCATCRDTGNMVVFDQCERCRGVGCHHCDEGLVRREVTCPDCRESRRVGVYQRKL